MMGLRFHKRFCFLFFTFVLTVFLIFTLSVLQTEDVLKSNFAKGSNINNDAALRRYMEEKHPKLLRINQTAEVIDNKYRANYVREMMAFAWKNYQKYAWGQNELRPISKIGHASSVFGRAFIGATIVDAIDTLHIMGLTEEYNDAREWIANTFNMKDAQGEISVFETNIRYVGGFLAAYALTADKMFLDKAREVADLLLPAFNTPTGIPLALVNMRNGRAVNYGWASGGCSILSEFGSLELEFDFLSKVSGNKTYVEKARRVREVLDQLEKPDGLYPLYLNPRTGKFCLKHVSVGALGDSFFEYLFKIWLYKNKSDSQLKATYDAAIEAIEKHLLFKSEKSKLWYFVELRGSRTEYKMDHLACFIAGVFALQSRHETDPQRRAHYLELGVKIAKTCHEGYVRTATGIGPETMRFSGKNEATTNRDSEMYYILRPEVVEGWFVLYRVTGDEKYRDWCWAATLAIDRFCRVSNGFSGIRNVYSAPEKVEYDDVQQSFFLSETLKYLYLTFSEPDVISLDKYVLNTEAHPFPIQMD